MTKSDLLVANKHAFASDCRVHDIKASPHTEAANEATGGGSNDA